MLKAIAIASENAKESTEIANPDVHRESTEHAPEGEISTSKFEDLASMMPRSFQIYTFPNMFPIPPSLLSSHTLGSPGLGPRGMRESEVRD